MLLPSCENFVKTRYHCYCTSCTINTNQTCIGFPGSVNKLSHLNDVLLRCVEQHNQVVGPSQFSI